MAFSFLPSYTPFFHFNTHKNLLLDVVPERGVGVLPVFKGHSCFALKGKTYKFQILPWNYHGSLHAHEAHGHTPPCHKGESVFKMTLMTGAYVRSDQCWPLLSCLENLSLYPFLEADSQIVMLTFTYKGRLTSQVGSKGSHAGYVSQVLRAALLDQGSIFPVSCIQCCKRLWKIECVLNVAVPGNGSRTAIT